MSAATGGYSSSGHGGGAGGDGKRPHDPHGKDHPNSGGCPRCGFDRGPRAHRQHMVHRLDVPCPFGCRVEFHCRTALRYHVWFVHRSDSEGCVRNPADPPIACHRCGCAWPTSDDPYMQNHVNYCQGP